VENGIDGAVNTSKVSTAGILRGERLPTRRKLKTSMFEGFLYYYYFLTKTARYRIQCSTPAEKNPEKSKVQREGSKIASPGRIYSPITLTLPFSQAKH
jgi:hypothetical protein